MCGITGIISIKESVTVATLKALTDVISHRGPDGEGYLIYASDSATPKTLSNKKLLSEAQDLPFDYIPKEDVQVYLGSVVRIGFAHRRLSIQDTSLAGHQPMSYDDNRYWIVLNGEIYNFLEIREDLSQLGYEFVSKSDTEVVLAAYKCWGVACQHRFIGMWAFVIYDSVTDEVFMSRDRFGIKPLYYHFGEGEDFYFASEIKQFSTIHGWQAKLNHQRAYDYLFYSLTDHTDETLFNGVYQIPPGAYFHGDITSVFSSGLAGKINYQKWYDPTSRAYTKSEQEAQAEFRNLFDSAIRLHLRADVLVGSALSGGLDSSAIVAYVNILLKQQQKENLQNTFSSCAEDERYSEKKWIDEVVKHTFVNANFVYPSGQDVFKLSEKIVWHLDEPYQSQSVFLGYHVFEQARENNVLVLLNGQGADEYLSGYSSFRSLRQYQLLVGLKLRKLVVEIADMGVPAQMGWIKMVVGRMLPAKIFRFLSHYSKDYKRNEKIFGNGTLKALKLHPNDVIGGSDNSVFEISKYQLFFQPLQKYLHWEDRVSMAHSVEARVPFLDHRLVEFVRNLPIDYLDGPNETKRLLVQSLWKILPEAIARRKDKMGFTTPEQRWLQLEHGDEFIKMLDTYSPYAKGIINREEALKYIQAVQKGDRPFDYTYWRIICFCVWMKVFDVSL